MALDQLKQLVPCLLLLSIMSSLSQAKAQQCNRPGSDENRKGNYSMDDTNFRFHTIGKDSGFLRTMVGLDLLRNLSDADVNNTGVFSIFDLWITLWQVGQEQLSIDEASFSITMVYQPLMDQSRSGLTFLILSYRLLTSLEAYVGANSSLAKQLVAIDISNPTTRSASVSGSSFSVRIGALANLTTSGTRYNNSTMAVVINIDPVAAAISNYSVWIDYDRVGHSLSVYVDVEGRLKPGNAIAEVNLRISSIDFPYVRFGLLSTTAQLLRAGAIKCSAIVEGLPRSYEEDKAGGLLSRKETIITSILGSIAGTAGMVAAVACYFGSRYRRWHKELDKLARSMERLPAVPKKVDFADIYKATRNFHEDMKLGGGGFGTVYRCTLPAAASKTGQPMDVAIKRFTRDVQDRRYDDFLAEVSIISRLRHKNIVPLIGWSYNKGVPLLVFEFMTNGSLDQHLFHGGGSDTRQHHTNNAIRQWAKRYEILKGIVTALHYVHHEYEPLVLHRDIKASNIMLDSSFRARLGDFGLASTVAVDRNSVTGMGGTWGYIAPVYPVCRKATRQTDIYALGVLILEVVTGQRALVDHQVVDDDDIHITDRVWRLHREGRLLECMDAMLINDSSLDDEEQLDTIGDVECMLLLGLACSNPNPSDRPTMPEVVRVIANSSPPPHVPPQKPIFVWPPQEEGRSGASDDDSTGTSMMNNLDKSIVSTT
ncbi:probable L-type lectin-domain containing receptor kinase S.5 [Triticum dicoccoides]|uniref:probable L-type lectin-domain containing receptor kinase S.5 n=1 Tax=Triticum dicoccoides TaxID=85692 RepID=UPI0018916962|nr:probable L-type lectin-domain containing receptor kinase S.5 [Triticum dicoccoides]